MTSDSAAVRNVPDSVRVHAPVAPLLGEPRAAATQTSQYLNGHALQVLESRGDWLRVRGPDEYEGWMHRGYLGSGPTASHDRYFSVGCTARSKAGRTRALPLGALLDEDEVPLDGGAIRMSHRSAHFPTEGSAIAASALQYFEGTGYLWGGVTPWGADCSGFVQSIFGLHGVSLPRDAADQARAGVEIPASADALMAADLVFFSDRDDGRITHVGIAIGDSRMVHLALGRGGYAVDPLSGETDDYGRALRSRIRFARRVLI
jgi:cell wall-associated NlpC family hydrolase